MAGQHEAGQAAPRRGDHRLQGAGRRRLPEWCVRWCAAEHGKQLVAAAARLLVDLVGAEMGLLDQEMAKLAAYVGDAKRIDAADVDALVGNSRAENTWKIFDLIGDGQTGEALTLLDRLFDQGEDPFRLLGAFSMQLRRLAQAGRLAVQGTPPAAALEAVGVPPFGRAAAEKQMRRLGRRRLGQLYDWLLQTDLGLKGMSPLPPRTLFERLVVELARTPAALAPPRNRENPAMTQPAEAVLPRLLITLGDVAGIGPEIVARAWPQLFAHCRPVVVGDPGWLRRGLDLVGGLGDGAAGASPGRCGAGR